VTTGLGRTGTWYGFQHYALQPDIFALGKGLGNGYPVSAVAMTREVAERLEDSAFHYAQSHQNDPLACAIAREVIAVIREEELVERSDRVGAYFLGEMERVGRRHGVVKEVRGRGLMMAMEFGGQGGQDERFSLGWVYRQLMESGFLVGYKPVANLLRFYPALIIGEGDIAPFLEDLDPVLEGAA
jgi:acetylornithine aminotransferase